MNRAIFIAAAMGVAILSAPAFAQPVTREQAMRAAIHPVATEAEIREWLARVPVTRDWPPDFAEAMKGHGPAFIVEMSTAPGCIPCADLWTRLGTLGQRYGWKVRTIGSQEAMLRSGRLGLPWVGHPVAWARPVSDANRIIPIAIGTDHAPNLARNLYLAAKMLTGVKPAVGSAACPNSPGS